jgi:glycosyltransferase involved in cell wall biosynthesis
VRTRVVIIGPTPPPYHGCSVATEAVVRSELGEIYDIHHIDTSDRRDLNNLGRWDPHNVYLALRDIGRLAGECLLFHPKVVYIPISQNEAGFLRDGLMILVSAWVGGAAVVVHLHGSSFAKFYRSTNGLFQAFMNLAMGRVTRGIVLGKALRGEFRAWLSDEEIAVVPNGTEIPSRALRPESQDRSSFEVVFLGNLLKFKGVTILIEAATRAMRDIPNMRVRFAGRWVYDPIYGASAREIQKECMDLVARAPRPGAFEFLGEVDRKQAAEVLYNADVLVLPSKEEGLPLVILEAMAAGVAVVSSAGVGAIPEVVVDGETGILIPADDVAALADAISRLASDTDYRSKLARAGRERCIREYSLSVWTKRLDSELRAALPEAA